MSNNRRYLIAFQTLIVNSLILECTLPPSRLKACKGFFRFHSVFRFAGVSWSLFPTVVALSVPICTDRIFREVEKLPVFPFLDCQDQSESGKREEVCPGAERERVCCPARATTGTKAFSRKLQVIPALATNMDCTAHRTTSLHFVIYEILLFCVF